MVHEIQMARLNEVEGWPVSLLCDVCIVNGPQNPDCQTR